MALQVTGSSIFIFCFLVFLGDLKVNLFSFEDTSFYN